MKSEKNDRVGEEEKSLRKRYFRLFACLLLLAQFMQLVCMQCGKPHKMSYVCSQVEKNDAKVGSYRLHGGMVYMKQVVNSCAYGCRGAGRLPPNPSEGVICEIVTMFSVDSRND